MIQDRGFDDGIIREIDECHLVVFIREILVTEVAERGFRSILSEGADGDGNAGMKADGVDDGSDGVDMHRGKLELAMRHVGNDEDVLCGFDFIHKLIPEAVHRLPNGLSAKLTLGDRDFRHR